MVLGAVWREFAVFRGIATPPYSYWGYTRASRGNTVKKKKVDRLLQQCFRFFLRCTTNLVGMGRDGFAKESH